MIDIAALKARLEQEEGREYSPYTDTKGILTVGVGHNMEARPLDPSWTFPLTDAQVDQLLDDDTNATLTEMYANLPWVQNLDPVRESAVADLYFNMGWSKFSAFQQFFGFLQNGDYESAANDLEHTAWFGEVGHRGPEIVGLIRTGQSATI